MNFFQLSKSIQETTLHTIQGYPQILLQRLVARSLRQSPLKIAKNHTEIANMTVSEQRYYKVGWKSVNLNDKKCVYKAFNL